MSEQERETITVDDLDRIFIRAQDDDSAAWKTVSAPYAQERCGVMSTLDIRIVELIHTQPTLFGPPMVTSHYSLVDWYTDEPLQDEQGKPYNLASLPEAERATYASLAPGLRRMADEYAESED